ncbi:peptidoglycan DD-metalloendopeptidase family protein [Amantichitinum ursilacus]|uniref:Murein hydrolase activator NlpD n=1 Tax=Amantichitinum ursilacus TaxID=857265 RepID=A0A0N1JT11_9NEIS|nr:peptidoglycan DD-metalloendopeptidase family protein [Amantichitinum ursilacus]KPC53545.1 Murein hydrolase activator NlpD precursor [Amantichitinum ursilacus]
MTRRLLSTLCILTLLAACSSNPTSEATPAGYYRVQKGDTLYRIAVNNGQSVNNLVRWNNLKDATAIEIGQVLRVTPRAGDRPAPTTTRRPTTPPASETTAPAEVAPKIGLIWPAKGQVLKSGDRNNGIDIAGNRGDAVVAAAAGKVVYAGEGIRGYGKLLVIKHSEVYLTAYAHNDALAVKEGDEVKQGQRIASMGDSGAERVALHFELRYKGKAIDPTSALP